MFFDVTEINLVPHKFYRGWIVNHRIYNEKLYIEVEFEECRNTFFLKVLPISTSPQSDFVVLAEKLRLFTEEGRIETDYLNDKAVLANLRRGTDNRLYVNQIKLNELFYATQDDDEDEEDEDYIYIDGEEE